MHSIDYITHFSTAFLVYWDILNFILGNGTAKLCRYNVLNRKESIAFTVDVKIFFLHRWLKCLASDINITTSTSRVTYIWLPYWFLAGHHIPSIPPFLHLSSSLHPSISKFFLILFPHSTSLILPLLLPTLSPSPLLALTSLSTFLPPFQHFPVPCLTSCLVLPFTRCTGTGTNFTSQPYSQLVSLYGHLPTATMQVCQIGYTFVTFSTT